MNFLAHLWLADRTRTALAGAILGDVVRGATLSAYPEDIRLGIRLHRRIDACTDRHPGITAARLAFPQGDRRYAGIVLDLVADYLLARAWPAYSDESLEGFCDRSGLAMAAAGAWFAQAGAPVPDARGFSRLLQSYASGEGIDVAIRRTATRLKDPQPLIEAGRGWRDVAPRLEPELPQLLADLLAASQAAVQEFGTAPP